MELGADFVATGHYVRRIEVNSKKPGVDSNGKKKILTTKSYLLTTARDASKDQSYFLWAIKPEQLKRCLFPVGDYIKKTEVRKLAKKFGLPNAEKKDSQGICFLGQVMLPDFLKKYIKPKKGKILDVHGNELGEHHGAHFYTIGQRHGLNISNKRLVTREKGYTQPHYVVSKDVKKNIVIVAEGEDHPSLYRKEIALTDVNLFGALSLRAKRGNLTAVSISVYARVRYRQPLAPAILTLYPKPYTLVFRKPIKFVAEGQSAVFYDAKGVLLGGGVIKSAK